MARMGDSYFFTTTATTGSTIQIFADGGFTSLGKGYAIGYATLPGQRQEWVLNKPLANMPPHAPAKFVKNGTNYGSVVAWRDAVPGLFVPGGRYVRAYSRTYTPAQPPATADYPTVPAPLTIQGGAVDKLREVGFEPYEIRRDAILVGTRMTGLVGGLPIDVITTPFLVPARPAASEMGSEQFDTKAARIIQNNAEVGWLFVTEITSNGRDPETTYEHFAFGPNFYSADKIATRVEADPNAPTTDGTLAEWQGYVGTKGYSAYTITACRYYTALPTNMGQVVNPIE